MVFITTVYSSVQKNKHHTKEEQTCRVETNLPASLLAVRVLEYDGIKSSFVLDTVNAIRNELYEYFLLTLNFGS